MAFESINPATGQLIASYSELTSEELRAVLEQSPAAFDAWRNTAMDRRIEICRAVADLLRQRREALSVLMADEMGKPVREGRAEVDKCAWVCEYYADEGPSFLTPEPIPTEFAQSYVVFEPLGPLLAIMPWNFPLWQVFRCTVPAVVAGNIVLLKHAPNVTGCALAIAEVLKDAGLPENVFRVLLISHRQAEAVLRHRAVRAVTLTGSTRAGRAVGKVAGEELKKAVFELGGSDPYVVLHDADLDQAVEACAVSRLINSGQSCIAAKRFVVVRSRYDEFERRLVDRMAATQVGDPHDANSTVGPLARGDLRDTLHQQVQRSVALGARVLLGGVVPDGPGTFYPPTVLSHVGPGMPAYDEELFGPVAALIPADDEKHALNIANDSAYGLGSAVFSADVRRAGQIAERELRAGSCFVNAFVRSDPRLPFGGIKDSGYGRELSHFGIREFVNIKTIVVV